MSRYTLVEGDKKLLSTWFELYQDTPMTSYTILSLSEPAFTDALANVAKVDDKISHVVFTKWLYEVESRESFDYVLRSYIRPSDGRKLWYVEPSRFIYS